MQADKIRRLAQQPESDMLEFKVSAPSSDVIAQEIAAFANTRGGTLLIGVADDGVILGISDVAMARRNIDSPPYTFFLLNGDMELNRYREPLVQKMLKELQP